MKRTAYIALLAGVIGFAIGQFTPSVRTAVSAEKPEQKGDQNLMAAMKIDITPLRQDLDKILESLSQIKEATATVEKSISQLTKSTTDVAAKGTLLSDISDNLKAIAKQTERPSKWEYKFIAGRVERNANLLGQEGWELVATTKDDFLLFKRPAKGE